MHRFVALVVVTLSLFAVSTAFAEDTHVSPDNTLGLRIVGGAAFEHGHNAGVLGVGLQGERAFFDHLMELELVAAYMQHGEHAGFDSEAVLNFPWSPSATFDFYAGGGGMLEYDGHDLAPGVLVDFGSRAWATHHWGVGVEVDFVHLFNEAESNAVEGIIAALYRF